MGLIVLMFSLQTVHSACDWYITWLGFIYDSNAPDQALDVLETGGTSHSVHVIYAMDDLLTPLRLGIADSIMVSTFCHFLLVLLMTFDSKVWRCWIICNRSWTAAIVPLLFNVGSIGMRQTVEDK